MELRGIGIGDGAAVGPILKMRDAARSHDSSGADEGNADPARTRARVAGAIAEVAADLSARAKRAEGEGEQVLAAAALMVQDPTAGAEIAARIDAGDAAEAAVRGAFSAIGEQLAALGGDIAERAADVADVAERVVWRLTGIEAPAPPESDEPYVLVASTLAPADTAVLDLSIVRAFVTRDGGPSSHTAILARSRGIPAIVGVDGALDLPDGALVVVDARDGVLTVDPDPDLVAAATGRAQRSSRAAASASERLGAAGLADGTPIAVLANLASPHDAALAAELGAEGIGLVRTEFLFGDAPGAPGIDRQTERYLGLLEPFPGKRVVVRMFDAGADKPVSFLPASAEPTPALGVRGWRSLRANEAVLHAQLDALAAAQDSSAAELWVMAPMIADAAEAEAFVTLARSRGLAHIGVMAEVPAIALIADELMDVVDFVSIGTNDLVQYTLAADRMLASLAAYQDPWHPAVLRMVALLARAGFASGTPVGVCGEAAADAELAVVLVGLGVTSLSAAPGVLPELRARLAEVTLEQATARAAAALSARTGAEARRLAG